LNTETGARSRKAQEEEKMWVFLSIGFRYESDPFLMLSKRENGKNLLSYFPTQPFMKKS
jgi:hypothetical protein